jgi:hypothetical protein
MDYGIEEPKGKGARVPIAVQCDRSKGLMYGSPEDASRLTAFLARWAKMPMLNPV